ncbi:MAG: hypothetical protein M3Y87_32845 [Myxococcota bacterium]|nr:hypothetical protein [Myxococcota bacterium]
MSTGLFAYDPRGRLFAIGCGSELLVHDGASEAPLWRRELDESIVGVDVCGDELVVLTEPGFIVRFGLRGRELGRLSLGAPARSLAVAPSGWIAATHEERISVLRRGDLAATDLPHGGVTAMAWSADGTKLLLGTRDGALIELRAPSWTEAREAISADTAIATICWSARGVWLVGSGDRVLRVEPGATETKPVTRASGQAITALASAPDGARFAMQLGDSTVVVLSDPPGETIAQLRYPERRACGIAFGPERWLGVGLDTGDANKLDITTGALHRSDTHPDRMHSSWLVAVSTAADQKIELEKKRAPSERPAKKHRAPPQSAPLAYDDPPADEGPSPWLVLRLVITGIAILFALLRLMD